MIANIPRLIAKTPFCNIEHPYGRSNKGQWNGSGFHHHGWLLGWKEN
jgi:hypothetical protein